jgi:hypothetical protein
MEKSVLIQKNVSRIRKKTFYLHQKKIFNTPKVIKNKDTYVIYPRKFAGSTQNVKKNVGNVGDNQNKNVPKKTMFRTLKV